MTPREWLRSLGMPDTEIPGAGDGQGEGQGGVMAKCFMCGSETSGSMGGPYVCPTCDCYGKPRMCDKVEIDRLRADLARVQEQVRCHHEETEDNGTGDLRCKACGWAPHSLDWWCQHVQSPRVKELQALLGKTCTDCADLARVTGERDREIKEKQEAQRCRQMEHDFRVKIHGELDAALEVLLELEWEQGFCPTCMGLELGGDHEDPGHLPGCKLAKVLGRVGQ